MAVRLPPEAARVDSAKRRTTWRAYSSYLMLCGSRTGAPWSRIQSPLENRRFRPRRWRHIGCTADRPVTPQEELKELVAHLGLGNVAPVAHDTAWVARVGRAEAPNAPAFPEAIDWLLRHQQGDGTWGGRIAHHQDRVLSTLAAMLALAQWRETLGAVDAYTDRLHAAGWGIAPHLAALGRDPCALVAFHRQLAASLAEARWRGLVLPVGNDRPRGRAAATPAGDLREDGSAGSPAATARYLLRQPDSRPARAHLQALVARHGGAAAPDLEAAGLLEPAWVLHNVALTWPEHPSRAGTWSSEVASLRETFAARRLPADPSADDGASLALAFRVLCWAGEEPDPARLRGPQDETDPAPDAALPALPAGGCPHLLPGRAAGSVPVRRSRGGHPQDGRLSGPDRHHRPLLGRWPERLAVPRHRPCRHRPRPGPQPHRGGGGLDRADAAARRILGLLRTLHGRGVGVLRAGARLPPARGRQWSMPGAIEAGARWIEEARPRTPQEYEPLWVGEALFAPIWIVHATVLSALILAGR